MRRKEAAALVERLEAMRREREGKARRKKD